MNDHLSQDFRRYSSLSECAKYCGMGRSAHSAVNSDVNI